MGSSYSYLKIKIGGDLVGVFAYKCGSGYWKQSISTHSDNLFNLTKEIDYNTYYYFGDWYYFDGDRQKLDRILCKFNPKTQSLEYLISRLTAQCALQKYESICAVLKRWAWNTAQFGKALIVPAVMGIVKCLFLGGGGNAIMA